MYRPQIKKAMQGFHLYVLKFDSWQLKKSKITGKKFKIGQKSVKKWSNGLDPTIHGSSLILQNSPKKNLGL